MLHTLIGIVAHKWAASLALGIFFNRAMIPLRTALLQIFTFSSSTPIGIIVGMSIADEGDALLNGIFLSMAGGTFIYIATTEILSKEFDEIGDEKLKYFFLCLGSATLSLFLCLDED